MTDRPTTRRKVLLGVGTAATLAIAGCGGGDGTTTDDAGGDTTTTTTTTTEGGMTTTEGGMTTTEDGMTTTEDGMTTTEDGMTTTTAGETASVRVAHMAPNAPNVDVYVDSEEPVLSDVPFGAVSDYLQVPAGERQVEITAAGDPETSVFSGAVPVEAGTDYTIAATGEVGDMASKPFQPLVLEDDNTEVDSGQARLRVVHASPDAPAVDVTAGDGSVVLFDGVAFGESGYTTVEAGDYTVQIRGDTDSNDGDVVADFDVSLDGGTVYTAFAAGYLSPDDAPANTPFDLFVVQDSGGM